MFIKLTHNQYVYPQSFIDLLRGGGGRGMEVFTYNVKNVYTSNYDLRGVEIERFEFNARGITVKKLFLNKKMWE